MSQTPPLDPPVRVEDPDADPRQRRRYAIGDVGFGIGGLTMMLALGLGVATLVGAVGGWFLPVLLASIGIIGVSAAMRAGIEDPWVTFDELHVEAPDAAHPAFDALGRQWRAHAQAVERLGVLSGAVNRFADVPELDDVVTAGQRVAFVAARALRDAADAIRLQIVDPDGEAGDPSAAAVAAMSTVPEALDELEELVGLLGPEDPAPGRGRHARAVAELAEVNDWLRLRRSALEDLAREQPAVSHTPRRPPADGQVTGADAAGDLGADLGTDGDTGEDRQTGGAGGSGSTATG